MDHDMDLVRRVADGKEDAWREIQRIYEPWLFGFVLRRVGRHADAEDIVQDVLIGLLRNAATYEGRVSLRGWLRVMAERAICSYLRVVYRERGRMSHDEEAFEAGVREASLRQHDGPEQEAEAHEVLEAIRQSLGRQFGAMPPRRRRAVAAMLGGEPNIQVARREQINVNTAGCWKHETVSRALADAGVD